MCGIVGFSGDFSEAIWLKEMNAVQLHRGPDDGGEMYCELNGVHLAMRRLSILDFAGGRQPMSSPDGRFVVVFNGEIFNAPDLRLELEQEGVLFSTDHSDTEVLIHLYARYGRGMVERLNGMFAFVIYDRVDAKLFCARDQFGIKPFCYSIADGRFCFASEVKSLQRLPWISRELDADAIYQFFSFQSIPSPKTIFKDIQKLPSAHWLEWDLRRKEKTIQRYWNPRFGIELPCQEAEISDYILTEFRQAVARWSLSDVPIACSLSGGLDSSSLTALMSDRYPIKTFSLGFADSPDLDERYLARKVAELNKTEHHEVVISVDDLLLELDEMLVSLDEPYAGGLPSWFVFKAMAKEVKVGISGTGGDELFGNYGKWLPYEKLTEKAKAIRRYWQRGGGWRDTISHLTASFYQPMCFPDNIKLKSIFAQSLLSKVTESSERFLEELWDSSGSPRNSIAKLDFQLQLPEEFLFMTDRFSMAHSLEVRTPFLDKIFAEKILAIPAQFRTSPGDLKGIFKDSVCPLLPSELLKAPKKGFVLPMDNWLHRYLHRELIEFSNGNFLRSQGIFRVDLYEIFVRPFLEGKTNNANQMWTWWMFQRWWNLNFVKG